MTYKIVKDGQPCKHKGSLGHVSHPCEGCGRIAGRGDIRIPYWNNGIPKVPESVGAQQPSAGESAPAETPLAVCLNDGELVIRVGVNVLASAIARGDSFHQFDEENNEYFRDFSITNPEQFGRDIVIALEREREDGSSPLSDLLDKMGQAAIDDGSSGVEYGQHIAFDAKSPNETW